MTDELHPDPIDAGTPDELADDPMIARMRSALDEAARVDPATPKPAATPDRRRWLAVAAAGVLVAGGIAALAVNLSRDHTPVTGPVPTDVTDPISATTEPPTSTLPATGDVGWYEITASGLTARPPEFTLCCPPMPAPGPDVVMAWTDNAGGIFTLHALGHVDGSPAELQFAHTGMSDERAKELEAKVVPGSGLPYVLDDPGMELLAQGFDGIGTSVSQRYIPTTGDGDVVLTVGDYTGQLGALAGPFPVEATTIANQAGVRYATNSSVVYVWQTPDKTWAELSIAAALADRADEIAASLVAAPLPTESAPTTTVSVPSVPASTGLQITGWAGTALPTFDPDEGNAYPGTPVPTFTVGQGAQAVTVDPATNGARPTVFVFFAEWSPHSKLLVETIVKAFAAGDLPPGTQLVLVRSADLGDSRSFNSDDIEAWGYDGPIYFDIDKGDGSPGQVATAFGANGYPFLVVAGPDGTLQRRGSGEMEVDALAPFVSGAWVGDNGFHLTAPGTDFDVRVSYDQFAVQGWFIMTDAPDPITATPENNAIIAANPDRNSSVASPALAIGQEVVYDDGTDTRRFVVVGWKRGYDGVLQGSTVGAVVIVSYQGTSDVPWEGYLAPVYDG